MAFAFSKVSSASRKRRPPEGQKSCLSDSNKMNSSVDEHGDDGIPASNPSANARSMSSLTAPRTAKRDVSSRRMSLDDSSSDDDDFLQQITQHSPTFRENRRQMASPYSSKSPPFRGRIPRVSLGSDDTKRRHTNPSLTNGGSKRRKAQVVKTHASLGDDSSDGGGSNKSTSSAETTELLRRLQQQRSQHSVIYPTTTSPTSTMPPKNINASLAFDDDNINSSHDDHNLAGDNDDTSVDTVELTQRLQFNLKQRQIADAVVVHRSPKLQQSLFDPTQEGSPREVDSRSLLLQAHQLEKQSSHASLDSDNDDKYKATNLIKDCTRKFVGGDDDEDDLDDENDSVDTMELARRLRSNLRPTVPVAASAIPKEVAMASPTMNEYDARQSQHPKDPLVDNSFSDDEESITKDSVDGTVKVFDDWEQPKEDMDDDDDDDSTDTAELARRLRTNLGPRLQQRNINNTTLQDESKKQVTGLCNDQDRSVGSSKVSDHEEGDAWIRNSREDGNVYNDDGDNETSGDTMEPARHLQENLGPRTKETNDAHKLPSNTDTHTHTTNEFLAPKETLQFQLPSQSDSSSDDGNDNEENSKDGDGDNEGHLNEYLKSKSPTTYKSVAGLPKEREPTKVIAAESHVPPVRAQQARTPVAVPSPSKRAKHNPYLAQPRHQERGCAAESITTRSDCTLNAVGNHDRFHHISVGIYQHERGVSANNPILHAPSPQDLARLSLAQEENQRHLPNSTHTDKRETAHFHQSSSDQLDESEFGSYLSRERSTQSCAGVEKHLGVDNEEDKQKRTDTSSPHLYEAAFGAANSPDKNEHLDQENKNFRSATPIDTMTSSVDHSWKPGKHGKTTPVWPTDDELFDEAFIDNQRGFSTPGDCVLLLDSDSDDGEIRRRPNQQSRASKAMNACLPVIHSGLRTGFKSPNFNIASRAFPKRKRASVSSVDQWLGTESIDDFSEDGHEGDETYRPTQKVRRRVTEDNSTRLQQVPTRTAFMGRTIANAIDVENIASSSETVAQEVPTTGVSGLPRPWRSSRPRLRDSIASNPFNAASVATRRNQHRNLPVDSTGPYGTTFLTERRQNIRRQRNDIQGGSGAGTGGFAIVTLNRESEDYISDNVDDCSNGRNMKEARSARRVGDTSISNTKKSSGTVRKRGMIAIGTKKKTTKKRKGGGGRRGGRSGRGRGRKASGECGGRERGSAGSSAGGVWGEGNDEEWQVSQSFTTEDPAMRNIGGAEISF